MRIAAASGVLLGGILVALMFRHDPPGARPEASATADRLILGKRSEPSPVGGPATARAASEVRGRKATILMPSDPAQSPPGLAREHTGADEPGRAGWGAALALPPLTRRDSPARTHRIVDGDTLEALAQRYLGSADRRLEIYEANRDVLPSAKLLPIGVELRIPPLAGHPPPSPGLAPQRPLVPIARPDARED